MKRRMTPARRERIFADNEGFCHICGTKIDEERELWHVDHIIPLAIGENDDDANLAPAHVSCHKEKTRQDVDNIAKCKRVARKHMGAHRSRNPLPGSRGGKLKRKLDGTVVPR